MEDEVNSQEKEMEDEVKLKEEGDPHYLTFNKYFKNN